MAGDALRPGLYESVMTSQLEQSLAELADGLASDTYPIHDAEAADRFAMHFGSALRRALAGLPEGDRASVASRIVGKLLERLEREVPGYSARVEMPLGPRVLRAVVPLLPDGTPAPVHQPITPLLDTTLLTNSKHDRNMSAHLKSEIRSAVGIDAIIAFIRRPGVAPVLPHLRELMAAGHRMRVLTTVFTGFTEVEALIQLQQAGAEIRVSYDQTNTRLHAKAWLFHRPAGAATAFVGSSNFTSHAMETGMEWNVRLAERRNPDAVAKIRGVFESYWASADFVPFDAAEFVERLPVAADDGEALQLFDIRPHPFQERLLEQLRVSREAGHHRNLLVAATGTGKTVMAALDYRDLRRGLDRSRLLFVAHRREILLQSMRTFRMVLGDPSFGELWVGHDRPTRFEHVFASIQALHAERIATLPPDHFDVVVVDEFHHAAAESYRRLLARVEPRELLGLTATPERADGLSVLDAFDGRIAAEMRLWDAIAEGRLAPFQYFAMHDGVSLLEVPWTRGRGYDVEGLEGVYTSDQAWARLVIRMTRQQVEVTRMRALGFCVSVGHARFTAAQFNAAGIPSVAVWGDTPRDERLRALGDLKAGRIRALFSVDLFTEGVDIPELDTLLLLRPTESATVFLQQLGRGLRKTEDKAVCTVLDFVSQHRREFRFDLRLRAMLGKGSRADLERNIHDGFPDLPPGASVHLDAVSSQIILKSLREALPSRLPQLVAEVRALVEAGHPATLSAFLDQTGIGLETIYTNRCFTDILRAADLPTAAPGPAEAALRKALGRLLHIDDRERLETLRTLLVSPSDVGKLPERERRLWRMLLAQLMANAAPGDLELAAATELLWQHPAVVAELDQLFGVLLERVDHEHFRIPALPHCPLAVHARYTRIEIQAALGDGQGVKVPTWREGVRWLPGEQVDALLVTLDKSGGNFSPTTAYHDYAMTRELFHWESQSTTSAESTTGRRYRTHRANGSRVFLFARMTPRERDFWFLGDATYQSHEGSNPMAVVWRLDHPIPADLYPDLAA